MTAQALKQIACQLCRA